MMADERVLEMNKIAEAIGDLTESPLYKFRKEKGYFPVVGEGNIHSPIMFIGEAPGEREAKTGRPFVGASGKFLDELLQSAGIRRQDVYITNIVKDRPPENRDPTQEEIRLYAPFLLKQIEIIQPQIIATLGRFAMDFLLNQFNLPEKGKKIGELHGKLLDAQAPYGHLSILPLYHPAVALYNQNQRETLQEDFQILKRFV
jgi:DNA polymerase